MLVTLVVMHVVVKLLCFHLNHCYVSLYLSNRAILRDLLFMFWGQGSTAALIKALLAHLL